MTLNPLFWLHLRISGSARINIIIVVAYAAVMIAFTGGSYYFAKVQDYPNITPATYARVDAAWLAVMTAAQCGFLLLMAPSAIRRAVQRDFDSGMIESHRLAPMSNLQIITGYMTGAPIQAFLLYAVSLLFGSYFAVRYAGSTGLGGIIGVRAALAGWYFAQGCIVVLAAMIGAFVLLLALATRGKSNVVGVALMIGVFGGWAAVFVVPGLALLMGVMGGHVLFGLLTGAKITGDPSVIVLGGALQFVIGLIFLAAACGKLRAPDRAVFSVESGLILLIVWGFTLVAGIAGASGYDWLFAESREHALAQLVCSTAAFMLVALFPLIAAAGELGRHDRAAVFSEPRPWRRCAELSFMPVLLGMMAATCWLMMSGDWAASMVPGPEEQSVLSRLTLVPVVLALTLSFWVDFNWIYHLAVRGRRILVWVPVMFLLLKGVPIMADSMIDELTRELTDMRWSAYGYLTGLSPIGTLMLLSDGRAALWVGLGFQALLAVGAAIVGRGARRSLKRINSLEQRTPGA